MDHLLSTKLFIPLTRPQLVSRPRLIANLDAGLNQKLTLLSAPVGFGKTTLMAEWLAHLRGDTYAGARNDRQIAWLSLDEGDNDRTSFLRYFIAALHRSGGIDPDLGKETTSLLQTNPAMPTESILTPLINEIAAVDKHIVLVLDDYHLVTAESVHATLTFLLEYLPPRLHLVIATREDPFLPLSRYRVRGQLNELRASDMRFTRNEAAEFLNQVMGLNLSVEDIYALETRTEGWIAGLQLAAISLQKLEDTAGFIKTFTSSHRLVLDYLIEEVLNQQREDIQSFLLQTAILDQMNGSLCDAITGLNSGQQTLEYLEQANLFIVPLDNERQWYRYHHLFADLLRQRLGQTYAKQLAALHRRASQWYEQKNTPSEAIRHAMASQDFERAADLAELAWPNWSEGYFALTWLGWLQELPRELVRTRPVLTLAFAWAYLNAGKLEAADAYLAEVEGWLAAAPSVEQQHGEMVVVDENQLQALPVSLAMARAYHAQAVGDVQGTIKYVERSLVLLPEQDVYNRASMTALLGLAYWADGNLEAAQQIFPDSLFQNDHDRIKGAFVVADMQNTLGNLHEAVRTCERALQLAADFNPPNPIGTEDIYTALSVLHRELGDLEAAQHDLLLSKQLGDQVELPDWQHRWCIAQAGLQESLGDLVQAEAMLQEAERLFVRTPVPEIRPIKARMVRLWIKFGRLNQAQNWVRERNLSVDDELSYIREFEHLTLVRVLIAQHQRDRTEAIIRQAQALLERLLEAAEVRHRTRSIIEILVLQALAWDAQENISAALKPLEQAVSLSERDGYQQLFVDEGQLLGHLLYEALSRGIKPEAVQKLLAGFPIKVTKQTGSGKERIQDVELIEPLSEREIEVLQLMAEGLTNPQIAERLYLSLNTVKAHTRNIYGKSEVNNRTQASARAKALGLVQ